MTNAHPRKRRIDIGWEEGVSSLTGRSHSARRCVAAFGSALCLGLASCLLLGGDSLGAFPHSLRALSDVAAPSTTGRRTAPLDASKQFSFTHVSKCAGSSWIRTLKGLLPEGNFFPEREKGVEWSVWYQARQHPADYHLISLKSPRHHVWSLFAQCKYGPWGKAVTRGTGFPRSGAKPRNDVADFERWLNHFVPLGGADRYGCYHPANYQSRALATTALPQPHGVENLPPSAERFEPDLGAANATYWEQDWAALTEFFHESQCLLYYRLGRDVEEARAYVDGRCRCPREEGRVAGASRSDDAPEAVVYVSHHSEGQRSTLRDLPPDALAKIAALTKVDVQIYKIALTQFMREMAWLESDDALGRRVLCDPMLRLIETELAYLDLNVTERYYAEKYAEKRDAEREGTRMAANPQVV